MKKNAFQNSARQASKVGRQQKNADQPFSRRPWQIISELFPPLCADVQKALELFPQALAMVWPLKPARRRELAGDIIKLSRLLTTERSELCAPYWSKPAFVSAYLYYFMPWNLIRECRLLAGLNFAEPESQPVLLDAGSGPLTLPLAIWLARPELRAKPVTVLAMDTAMQPLELGRKIFSALADLLGHKPWRIEIMQGPMTRLSKTYAEFRKKNSEACLWLITAANALNECVSSSRQKHRAGSMGKEERDPQDRILNLLESWLALLKPWPPCPAPELLFIEPGTRLGGSFIMNLRAAALEFGLKPLMPCQGLGKCPLAKETAGRDDYASWCHFTFSAAKVPGWLEELTHQTGFARNNLTLSALMLSSQRKNAQEGARVISGSFQTPGASGLARYGCSAQGLCLLEDSADLASGMLVQAYKTTERDKRSGAVIAQSCPIDQTGHKRP